MPNRPPCLLGGGEEQKRQTNKADRHNSLSPLALRKEKEALRKGPFNAAQEGELFVGCGVVFRGVCTAQH